MAQKVVLRDVQITVDAVNVSNQCSSITIEDSADEVDVTGFGSAYREFMPGLKDATITAEAFQDYSVGGINATVEPLYASGGSFDVVIKPTAAATSATNPSYTMTSRIYSRPALAGSVGDASTTTLTFRNAGAGIVKAIA